MIQVSFQSIREIIIGSFSDVEKVAHRLNKKALSILLQNDLQTVSYSARLGFGYDKFISW